MVIDSTLWGERGENLSVDTTLPIIDTAIRERKSGVCEYRRMVSSKNTRIYSSDHSLLQTWLFSCRLRCPSCLNVVPQTAHAYGFSPVCVLLWALRCESCVKLVLHTWHLYGRSPVCMRLCAFMADRSANAAEQNGQMCGFSPVWSLETGRGQKSERCVWP